MMKKIAPRIIIDPKIRFGKPIIKGTRIRVEELMDALAGGMPFEEIKKEYGVKKLDILAVVNYAFSFIKGTDMKPLETLKV